MTMSLEAAAQAMRDRELEAKVRQHAERADRAERWLHQVSVEIEQIEAITDTIERLDHIELDIACHELLAQPLDVAVDGPVVHIHLIVVGCIHQGVAAFHHSRPARERPQDEKLGDGERDQLVFPGAGMPLLVHT
jgi:hypothetical protein